MVVAFDGPPGAGKTSLLARLAPAIGDRCLFFTEPNITLARQPCPPVDPTPAERSLWFLRHELAKARRCATLLADPATQLLVFDRNHLGALAYCYATRVDGSLPYARAADFYARPHRSRTCPPICVPSSCWSARTAVSSDGAALRNAPGGPGGSIPSCSIGSTTSTSMSPRHCARTHRS